MSQKRPFWPFWPAISEAGWTSRKKVPLGIRLKSARRSHMRISLHVNGAELKLLTKNHPAAGGVTRRMLGCILLGLWLSKDDGELNINPPTPCQ